MAGANDDLAARIRSWVRQHCPGPGCVHIEVDVTNGIVKRANVDWQPDPSADAGHETPPDPLDNFRPTDSEAQVLEALEGVVLKGADLERKSGLEHKHLYEVLKKLQKVEAVKRDPARGYYRPDAPPPELAD